MRRLAIVLAASAAVALMGSACGGDASANEVTVTIQYSLFEPRVVTVQAGQPITLTLENKDPIDHEWIVGTADLHERHRTGTEPYHDAIPAEVTIPSLSTRETTFELEPGVYEFICHLPGHERYGMTGTLEVVEG